MKLSELMEQLNALREEVRTEAECGVEFGDNVELEILNSLVCCLWNLAGARATSQWLDEVRRDLIMDETGAPGMGDMVHISVAIAEVMSNLGADVSKPEGRTLVEVFAEQEPNAYVLCPICQTSLHEDEDHSCVNPDNEDDDYAEDDGKTIHEAASDLLESIVDAVGTHDESGNDALVCEAFGFMGEEEEEEDVVWTHQAQDPDYREPERAKRPPKENRESDYLPDPDLGVDGGDKW